MQGFNMGRYVPPDQEGVVSGNQANKKHALGARAAKLASEGILTVRFEMPFAVWCGSCPQPMLIGQGVRFNAEKKKVGQYYSTPVYSFRMRHAACGGAIEIRTDPQHTTYAVVAGGKKRDTGVEADAESLVKSGEFAIVTNRERRDQRESAFANLEKTIADREQLALAKVRVEELQDASARGWDDPYAQNQRLRRAFRAGRKGREKDAAAAEDLKDRMSLGIDLLPGTEEDARRAALVDFGGDLGASPVEQALARPLFDDATSKGKAPARNAVDKPKGMLKADVAAAKTRDNLASLVASNTRVARDPFLGFGSKDTPKAPPKILGIKRKLPVVTPPKSPEPPEPSGPVEDQKTKGSVAPGLVGYDSESD